MCRFFVLTDMTLASPSFDHSTRPTDPQVLTSQEAPVQSGTVLEVLQPKDQMTVMVQDAVGVVLFSSRSKYRSIKVGCKAIEGQV